MKTQSARDGRVLARALLFLPAVALLGLTLWRRAEAPGQQISHGEPTEPMRTGAVGSIDGWEARLVREGAAPLRLRLESLHPEAGRQAFDAKALAQRLRAVPAGVSLEDSEPWRLTLSVAARPDASSSGAARAGEAGAVQSIVVEDLSEVRLMGLEPLVPTGAPESGQPGAPQDPLVSLFQFPAVPLLEGEACDLVFWGRAPEGGVRAILPGLGEVELMAKARAAAQSTRSIARLDGRAAARGLGGEGKQFDAPTAAEGGR